MARRVKPTDVLSAEDAETMRLVLMASDHQRAVGGRIRDARLAQGLSQVELARKLPGSVDGASVSRWERGGVMPREETLEALAKALGVEVWYFHVEPPSNGKTPQVMPRDDDDRDDLAKRLESKLDEIVSLLELLTSGRPSTQDAPQLPDRPPLPNEPSPPPKRPAAQPKKRAGQGRTRRSS